MEFRSITNLEQDIREYILPHLPRDIGTVYGCPRSGMLPATIIATAIGADLGIVGQNTPLLSGDRKRNFILPNKGKKVLLVDDSSNTGSAMALNKKALGIDCLTCAVYTRKVNRDKLDFAGPTVEGYRFFEWQFQGAGITKESYFDMDGVLCQDPKPFDDDGKEYQDALRNAKPLYLPQVKIKAICTNRLDRWRGITEEWLAKYNVQYDHLIMQPFKTAAERRKQGNPGKYKAKHYKKSDAKLFVESHNSQAKVIADESGKPCLSIESMKLF